MIPGIHASVSGGLDRALDILREGGLGCGQIFTSNQRQWKGRQVREIERERFSATDLRVFSHSSYLINLSSSRPEIRERSRDALREELERIHQLGIAWTVLHPGAHLGSGESSALKTISRTVRKLLEDAPSGTGILFENTAGQGTVVGHSPEQLSLLLEETGMPSRTGICLDTCHAFAAGYDISTIEGVDGLLEKFQSITGVDRIIAFHMNDCSGPCGRHLDRHASLGTGLIGLKPLKYLASLEDFRRTPGIVETPGSDQDRIEDALSLIT